MPAFIFPAAEKIINIYSITIKVKIVGVCYGNIIPTRWLLENTARVPIWLLIK
jgi:hypothetical protein